MDSVLVGAVYRSGCGNSCILLMCCCVHLPLDVCKTMFQADILVKVAGSRRKIRVYGEYSGGAYRPFILGKEAIRGSLVPVCTRVS